MPHAIQKDYTKFTFVVEKISDEKCTLALDAEANLYEYMVLNCGFCMHCCLGPALKKIKLQGKIQAENDWALNKAKGTGKAPTRDLC